MDPTVHDACSPSTGGGLEAAAPFILFLGAMERGVRGGLETARWFRTGNVDKCCICLFMFEFGALFLALALTIRVFILGVLWHGAPRERAKRGDGRQSKMNLIIRQDCYRQQSVY